MNPHILSTGAFLLPGAALVGGLVYMRNEEQQRDVESRRTFELIYPDKLKEEVFGQTLHALRNTLSGGKWSLSSPAIVLEVLFDSDGPEHRLRAPAVIADEVTNQLAGHIAGIYIDELETPSQPNWTVARAYGTSNSWAQLDIFTAAAASNTLLAAGRSLAEGEMLTLQVVFTSAKETTDKWIPRARGGKAERMFSLPFGLGPDMMRPSQELLDARKAKREEPNYHAILRIAAKAATFERAGQLAQGLENALGSVNGKSRFRRIITTRDLRADINSAAIPWKYPARLMRSELGAVSAAPIGSPNIPGLKRPPLHLPAVRGFPSKGIELATSTMQRDRVLAFRPQDTTTHVQIVGMTGTGKSNLLKLAIKGFLDMGLGFIFFQPKQQMNEEVLELIPSERYPDLMYLDPMDPIALIGVNPMAGHDPVRTASFLNDVLTSFYSVGVETGDVLYNALFAVARKPGMTLHEVARILTNEEFRNRITADLPDGMAKDFWDKFKAKKPADQDRQAEPVLRRLRPFLRSRFAGVFGQAKGIDIGKAIADGKIIIVNLAVGDLAETDAYLFAAIVMAMTWDAVQMRGGRSDDAMRPFPLIADEFPNYMKIPTSFDTMAATARGYEFPLWLVHQNMQQLGTLQGAFKSNFRNRIVFRLDKGDSHTLAQELEIEPDYIKKLGKYQAIFSTTVDGDPLPPATGKTLDPPKPKGRLQDAIEASRKNYGTPIADVEREMRERRSTRPDDSRKRSRLGG